MANVPASTSRKFNPADYKAAPNWFQGRFLSQLNLFTDPVYLALLNNLTFQQNFNAQYFAQVFKAGATPASNAFSFRSSIQGTPVECIKVACNVSSDYSIPITSAVDISWYYNAGVVYVTAVNGLTSGTTYRLVVRLN
jgi:hypothetical protein